MSTLGGIAASALNAFGVDMLVRADNIANVNTPGFQARNVSLMTGPLDKGVLVGLVDTNTTPGPPVPGLVPVDSDGREVLVPGYLEGSNTNIAREFTHMIAAQRAYEANAVSIRTEDDITGMLLNMVL